MLNRIELQKNGPPGFNLGQKEKDYIQHWSLAYLSQSGFTGVFKGGTCLQKAYHLPRYSEDLDFTLNNAEEPDLEAFTAFLASTGFSGLQWKTETNHRSHAIRLRFQGPLYNGTPRSENTIIFEFSKRENTLKAPEIIMITPGYPDLLPYSIKVMNKEEIAAEKIRALLTRKSARDLFDLYFLLHQKTIINQEFINQKLKYYKKIFLKKEFEQKIKNLQKDWKTEISSLTSNFLEYDKVADEVLKQVNTSLKD